MSETDPAFDDPHDPGVSPADLAARLASKLCHDFISPASAIISGLDLLDDPSAKDMRDDAMELIADSARTPQRITALLSARNPTWNPGQSTRCTTGK